MFLNFIRFTSKQWKHECIHIQYLYPKTNNLYLILIARKRNELWKHGTRYNKCRIWIHCLFIIYEGNQISYVTSLLKTKRYFDYMHLFFFYQIYDTTSYNVLLWSIMNDLTCNWQNILSGSIIKMQFLLMQKGIKLEFHAN